MVRSPNIKDHQGDLTSVSCTSASSCTAAGYSLQHGGIGPEVTLVERWSGKTWAIQPTPNPAGSSQSHLMGVSCTSAKACTAVGYYYKGPQHTMAERWNGKRWAIQPTTNPAGYYASLLSAVSCASANMCIAVGYFRTSWNGPDMTLAERWDGKSWTIDPTPNPNARNFLLGVSCTSATVCTAVGYGYVTTADDNDCISQCVTLAERWDGEELDNSASGQSARSFQQPAVKHILHFC